MPTPPVVHVLAQVVFPKPLESPLENKALFRAFADQGFFRAAPQKVSDLTFTATPGAEPVLATTERVYWTFADRDQQSVVVLSENSLVLHTSAYTGHDAFFAVMRAVFGALQAHCPVACADRIGLRYIDLIQIDQAQPPLRTIIAPELLGFAFRSHGIPVKAGTFATTSLAQTSVGTLNVRSCVVAEGQYLPPDLNADGVRRPDSVNPKLPGVILDFDHFTAFNDMGLRPLDATPDAIVGHLGLLHEAISAAFRAAVTPHALTTWGLVEETARA